MRVDDNMNKKEVESRATNKSESQIHRVRLPGFIADNEIGLGEFIKLATNAVGIKPCGGCERRAQVLDSWVRFTTWNTR